MIARISVNKLSIVPFLQTELKICSPVLYSFPIGCCIGSMEYSERVVAHNYLRMYGCYEECGLKECVPPIDFETNHSDCRAASRQLFFYFFVVHLKFLSVEFNRILNLRITVPIQHQIFQEYSDNLLKLIEIFDIIRIFL